MSLLRSERITAINGLVLTSRPVFTDKRGHFVATYVDGDYAELLPPPERFVEDDVSVSRRGVLKGLHGDHATWKLISCVFGCVFVVVVDMRRGSPTYLGKYCTTVDAAEGRQFLIPAGCVNGHQCLADMSVITYKQSRCYGGSREQLSVRWNDPALALSWPITNPLLSERDRNAPLLSTIQP